MTRPAVPPGGRPAGPGLNADLATLHEARRSMAASLIAVKGHLDEPYPDDPRWTPWTRFIERELQRLDETKSVIARVEAELARLTARRSRYAEGRYENCMEALSAAEARCARLQQALAHALDCKGSFNGTVSERGGYPAICTDCEAEAREALAGPGSEQSSLTESGPAGLPDTPADSHYRERPIEEDFYLDPRGEWVYRWSDERRVLKPADSQEDKT